MNILFSIYLSIIYLTIISGGDAAVVVDDRCKFKEIDNYLIFVEILVAQVPNIFSEPSVNNDDYYDGDQQPPKIVDLIQSPDCSSQCQPHWIEPVLQQKQTLVYPTSASVSFKCPYHAKPKPNITWYKDGQVFLPELIELVIHS